MPQYQSEYLNSILGKTPPPKSNNTALYLVIALVVGVLLFVQFDNQRWPFDKDDDQGQVIPDDKEKDKEKDEGKEQVSYEGANLVIVLDSETSVDQQLIVNELQDDENGNPAPILSKYKFAGFRKWDDDQLASQFYLQARPSPAVYIEKGGKILKSGEFPGSIEALEEFIKWQKN